VGVSIFAVRQRTAMAAARDVSIRAKLPQEKNIHLKNSTKLQSIALLHITDSFTDQGFWDVGVSNVREILLQRGRKQP
jgi:hypothetical protein